MNTAAVVPLLLGAAKRLTNILAPHNPRFRKQAEP
jgi:hypothetical protein